MGNFWTGVVQVAFLLLVCGGLFYCAVSLAPTCSYDEVLIPQSMVCVKGHR